MATATAPTPSQKPAPGDVLDKLAVRRVWLFRIVLILLWLLIGGLVGLGYGREAIGNRPPALIGPLVQLLGGHWSNFDYGHGTLFLKTVLKLIVVLSVGGNVFWFVRKVSRGTELAYLSFVVLLWVGILVVSPLPRAAQESAGVIELVHTRTAFDHLGDAFASIIRNQVGYLVFGCIATATMVARAIALAFEKPKGSKA